MSRLECLGKSATGSQKQSAVKVASAHAKTSKQQKTTNDKVGMKKANDEPRRGLSACAPPHSAQLSSQETQRSVCPNGDVLNTDECSPKKSTNVTPRVEEEAQATAMSGDELKMKDLTGAQPLDSAVTAEPLPTHEAKKEEQTEVEDEDLKAPVELIMEFLKAVMGRNFQLASKLCRMILIYEPDNPEASEFLPLIQKKLLEEQEADQSTEDEDEDDDDEDDGDEVEDDDDSGGDVESSQSSSCSSSPCPSSSPSDEDEEEERPVNRHKPCPPSHILP